MNNLDTQYLNLLQDIMNNGVRKNTRNGEVLSVFGRSIRYKFKDGKFPLLTTKKMAFKSMVVELLWFLRGESDIRYLWKNGCSIWDGDWYKSYSSRCSNPYSLNEMKEFVLFPEKHPTRSKHFGEYIWSLGSIYGHQWRNFNGVDQIQNLINELKTNPNSRRLMVNAWNVSDLTNMVLPPCHYGFQLYTHKIKGHSKRFLSLQWQQRSVDVPLGLPFNIASYGLLLCIIAKEVGMVPHTLIGSLGDTHIYLNQFEGVREQLNREVIHELPEIEFSPTFNDIINNKELTFSEKIDMFEPEHFLLTGYEHQPKIHFPLSN